MRPGRLVALAVGAWFGAVAWVACSPTHTAADEVQRQACYLQAEAAAMQAATGCPGAWTDCPERAAILRQLQADQERCP